MIEAGLVYIHFDKTPKGFVGCGSLVEGPFIVTCRHVWNQACRAAGDSPVLVCFPPPQGNGDTVFSIAVLADACDAEARPPDLVILKADTPPASAALPLACAGVCETGPASVLAGLTGRDPSDPWAVLELTIPGTIAPRIAASGLRQFTGADSLGYWPDRGSSGSPFGLNTGTTLTGILCMSETGSTAGAAAIHEAFLLPASTIHRYLCAHVGCGVAGRHGVDPAKMPAILDMLGAPGLSLAELRRRLEAYFTSVEILIVERAPAAYAEVVDTSEEESTKFPADEAEGISVALARSRALSASFEPAAAMAILDQALAKETRIRQKHLLLLLGEKTIQQRLLLDYQGAIETLVEITTLDPDTPTGWIELGDVQRRVGNREAGLAAYRAGLRAVDPANQQPFSTYQQRIGDLLNLAGDRAGALASYRACYDIARRTLDANPNDAECWHAVVLSYSSIGDVLRAEGDRVGAIDAYNTCLDILRPLAFKDPDQVTWKQDLSVVHGRIGNLLLATGSRSEALAAHRASLALCETLVAINPSITDWQQNLATAHHMIGDLLRSGGDLSGGLAEARTSFAIRKRIANHDTECADFQRELAASHNGIGDFLVLQGDAAGALQEFEAGLIIIQRLCARDPGQTGWQHDLSVSHDRIGNIFLERGDVSAALAAFQASLAIRRALCTRDQDNTQWQRELTVSYIKIGDVLREQANLDNSIGNEANHRSNLDAALKSFRAALAVADPLSMRDPENVEWQRDTSAGYNRIGEILLLQSDVAGALAAYQLSHSFNERSADMDPGSADRQRDLLVSCEKMSWVDPTERRAWLDRALAIATQLAKDGRLMPVDSWMISNLQARLDALPREVNPTSSTTPAPVAPHPRLL